MTPLSDYSDEELKKEFKRRRNERIAQIYEQRDARSKHIYAHVNNLLAFLSDCGHKGFLGETSWCPYCALSYLARNGIMDHEFDLHFEIRLYRPAEEEA